MGQGGVEGLGLLRRFARVCQALPVVTVLTGLVWYGGGAGWGAAALAVMPYAACFGVQRSCTGDLSPVMHSAAPLGAKRSCTGLLRDTIKSPAWVAVAVPFALWRLVQLASLEPVLRDAAVGTAWQASVAALVVVPVAAGACLLSLAQHCADIPALLRWKRQASFRSSLCTDWVYLLSLIETKTTDDVE